MADEQVLTGEVVRPELMFTTPQRETSPEPTERIPFQIDGETYTIIRPRKLDEVLSQLAEAGARRATTADILYAGANFLRRVLAPESAARIQARLDDDEDDLRLDDVFAILERIVTVLSADQPAAGPRPARARARR